ncbi:hypothetical protein YYC_05584 [Plasmodium yoelii 17X]|uniref:Yir4 protein n=2 Tax=Plasmodium yoelii TaxID=5861 RepID=Q7RR87_PLAYO|nr:putative yir4 protein [Plasmodium yoelii yoelii]ETB56439.1 hypothetical protein YYC_05584 [Plasmodium yoelii 17X]
MMWLGYMLSLKNNAGTNNLTYFYSTFINRDEKYNKAIKDPTDYKNYKNLIDKKQDFMNMDIRIISKFYDAFKILCNMYSEYKKENTYCKNYLKKDKFVEKYEELNKDPNITEDSPCHQILSTLPTDYNNLKKNAVVLIVPICYPSQR